MFGPHGPAVKRYGVFYNVSICQIHFDFSVSQLSAHSELHLVAKIDARKNDPSFPSRVFT